MSLVGLVEPRGWKSQTEKIVFFVVFIFIPGVDGSLNVGETDILQKI